MISDYSDKEMLYLILRYFYHATICTFVIATSAHLKINYITYKNKTIMCNHLRCFILTFVSEPERNTMTHVIMFNRHNNI